MFKKLIGKQSTKDRARVILLLIAGAIIIPLGLSFGSTMFRRPAGPGGTAGTIFGQPIDWEDFQQEYRALERSWQQQLGGSVPEQLVPIIKQQVWSRLLVREAAKRRVKISDAELRTYISKQDAFREGGVFRPDRYYRYAQMIGASPKQLDNELRGELQIQKLVDSVRAKASVSDDEVRAAYAKDHDRLRLIVGTIADATFEPDIAKAVTDADVKDAYIRHPEVVRIPAMSTYKAVGKTLADIKAEQPEADDKQAHKALALFASDLADDHVAKLRLEEIAQTRKVKIRAIGPLSRGEDAPDGGPSSHILLEAASIPIGQVSSVLKTEDDAWLVQRTTEETPARVPPIEEVKGKVREWVIKDRVKRAAEAKAVEVRRQVEAALAKGTKPTDAFQAAGIPAQRPTPAMPSALAKRLGVAERDATGWAELAHNTAISEPARSQSGYVLAVLEERLPFEEASFTADREALRAKLLDDKQTEELDRWMTALRQEARMATYTDTPAASPHPSAAP